MDVVPAPPMDVERLQRACVGIGVATAASGCALMLAPRLALAVLGAAKDEPAPFLFRVVGMFMAVSGGSLAEASKAEEPSPTVLRWALVTKVGAAVLVSSAVLSKRFGPQAGLLAAVDGGSAAVLAAVIAKRP